MIMDEFVELYLFMIEKPIVKNGKIGFMLSNGIPMFFKDTFISRDNSKRLRDYYKNKGIV